MLVAFAYQQFEDRILAPRVYGSALNLSPLAVFLASLCGAQRAGADATRTPAETAAALEAQPRPFE